MGPQLMSAGPSGIVPFRTVYLFPLGDWKTYVRFQFFSMYSRSGSMRSGRLIASPHNSSR